MKKVRVVAKQKICGVTSFEGLWALDGILITEVQGRDLYEIANSFMDQHPGYDEYDFEVVR